MGSWLGTCFLTNLPITDNDNVRVILLESNNNIGGGEGHFYPGDYWTPLFAPVKCTYNDYGCYVPIDDENNLKIVDLIISTLKKNIVEFDIGKNEYHDIAVKKDKLDWELINSALREDRLFVKDNKNNDIPLAWVAIHEHAWNSLLDIKNYNNKMYNYYIEKFNKHDLKMEWYYNFKTDMENNHNFRNSEEIEKFNQLIDSSNELFIDSLNAGTILKSMNVNFIIDNLNNSYLVNNLCELLTVNTALTRLRMTWFPCSGKGSQNTDYDLHLKLIKAKKYIIKQSTVK